MSLLETRQLTVRIAGRHVCQGLDLRLEAGERWCLLGRNGVGKTTLLLTLAGLRKADRGEVRINGETLDSHSPRTRARHIGLLPQDHQDLIPASVLETALTGRHPWLGHWQWESSADHDIAMAALDTVGLSGLQDRDAATLSGGERRRLGIATLLTQQTPVMLLDEPVNHLDIHQQIRMLEVLSNRTRNTQGSSLCVLHDLNLAARYCDKFLLLFDNGEQAQGSLEVALGQENLSRLYQHPLARIETERGPVWIPE